MSLKGGATPTEAAVMIALASIKAAYDGRTDELDYYASTKVERRALRHALAKLHNRLLNKSGMDGIALNEHPRDEE